MVDDALFSWTRPKVLLFQRSSYGQSVSKGSAQWKIPGFQIFLHQAHLIFPLQSHKKLARASGRLTDSPKFARREEVGTDVERKHFRNFSILVSPTETHASRYQFDQQPIGTRRLENFWSRNSSSDAKSNCYWVYNFLQDIPIAWSRIFEFSPSKKCLSLRHRLFQGMVQRHSGTTTAHTCQRC